MKSINGFTVITLIVRYYLVSFGGMVSGIENDLPGLDFNNQYDPTIL